MGRWMCRSVPDDELGRIREEVYAMPAHELFDKPWPTYRGTGFYPWIARCNHACNPNVKTYYDWNDSRLTAKALRPIAQGEQIFVTYIRLDYPVDIRQKFLKEYLFDCKCDKCIFEMQQLSIRV
eukprot:gnl/TRDRNA2_/TRDRNA2_171738_c1_seq1.p2 gnl/TRDRNA2_/TRDRNA2_171738_c1~~gnl/TRDRNA2_/TRDRNA2_171738_c1_seq1.p2  ORF type:complete len:124 (+),score=13.94 gnl/TRDRNA2_/TRDRNA2_171738_c1_seq1:167-538(+)